MNEGSSMPCQALPHFDMRVFLCKSAFGATLEMVGNFLVHLGSGFHDSLGNK